MPSLSTDVLPGGSLDPTPATADVDFSGTAYWAGILLLVGAMALAALARRG